MSGAPESQNPPETPKAGHEAGTGEGADSALQAMLRKRKQHHSDSSDAAPSQEGGEPTPPAKP